MSSRRIALLLVVSAACLTVLAEDKESLPTTEKGLFDYAQQHSNRRNWRKGEQAYKLLLERYPKTQYREEVYFRLGLLHMRRSRNYTEAVAWLDRLLKEMPDGIRAWPARFQRAELYGRMKQIAKAVEQMREIALKAPDASLRNSAAQRVLAIQNKYFGISVRQSFTEGETPFLQIQVRNINTVSLRMDRVAYADVIEFLEPHRQNMTEAAAKVKQRIKVKAWDSHFSQRKDNWAQHRVELPAVESGIYLVEAVVEGITYRVTVLVNKYGMIVKSAADRVLVFAQGRHDGKPVEGMEVRMIARAGSWNRKTDADGLASFDVVRDNLLFVGRQGNEYCFCYAYAASRTGPESRIYVSTDRPIYRPDQEVQFNVRHRVDEDGKLTAHKGLRLTINVRDTKNNLVHAEQVALNEFGSANGKFRLGSEPPLGVYSISIEPLDAMPGTWNRWSNRGQFRVDEYRKPEYEVDVAFSQTRYIMGENLRGTIDARYFFGSPVANAKVVWEIRRANHWSWWRPRPAWYAWYGEVKESSYGGGDLVAKGAGKTGADGKLNVTHALPRGEHDQRYTLTATVTDLSRRQEVGSSTVTAYRANVAVHVETERYVYLPNQPVVAKLEVRDHDRKPVGDAKVTVRAMRQVWSALTRKYREIEISSSEATTDAEGKARVELNAVGAGSIVLRASVKDAQQRETSSHRWVWVTARDWDGGTMNWRGIAIVPDKEAYAPGDVATFLITSEVKNVHLLFTLEANRVYYHKVVKMQGHAATLQIKLDDPGLLPNFFASAVALHGNKTYRRDVNIAIDPRERFLDIEIKPSKKQYKPGEPASFDILTRSANGEPVSAEVEFGVVDEAIFALQSEMTGDIRQFFVRRRGNQVRTNSSVQYWDWGQAAVEESKGEDREEGELSDSGIAIGGAAAPAAVRNAKGKKGGPAFVEAKVRTKFADTLLYRPSVITNAEGRATIDLAELSDDLTTWRLTARAMSAPGHIGESRASILVRKEVIARLQTPRFFTQGDRTTITAIVRNDLDVKKTMKIEISADGLDLDGQGTVMREVGPKGEARVEWKAQVARPGEVTFVLKALTDTESDALERKVQVLPYGSLEWLSRSGLIKGEATETLTLDPEGIAEATELTIVVTPTHAATVLDALDYLAGYPYGCVEQTMSRFLPSTITRQVLQRLDIKRPWLEEELPKMIRAGLDRLSGFQHPDGGWGWWKNDQSNPYTTAYVVYGLAMAQRADVKVDARMLANGIQALQRMLPVLKKPEERIYTLYSLSAAGQKVPDVRNALADGLDRLPAAGRAMLALVLHRDGESKEARRVLDSLIREANASGATAFWKGTEDYRWTGQNVEATALALEALLAIAPDHDLIPQVATWLALNREGGHWTSTRQTAMVVMAMAGYLEKSGTAAPDMKLELEVNGKSIWKREVTPNNWAIFEGTTTLRASDLVAGENKIVLRSEGNGTPVYSLYLRQFRRKANFVPSPGSLQVTREYFLIANGKPVPLRSARPIVSGDEIEVMLTVRADRPHDYLMIEDPMPSGFEAQRDYGRVPRQPRRGGWWWTNWWAHREFRDEKVAIAVTHLPAGERKVSYRMRAETPGIFRVLPTTVWNMYRPGEGANGASATIEVTPGDS